MENCIFCKIISHEIASERLYEDDRMIVIRDIDPKAKLHYLAVPKHHYALLSDMDETDRNNLSEIFATISSLRLTLGLEAGYRLIINQGDNAGQTVHHLHIHILGGQTLPFDDMSV